MSHRPNRPTRRLFDFDVLQPEPAPGMQTAARPLDPAQEPGIVFQSIFEPVFLRFETDQHASRLAMTRDDDLRVSASRTYRDKSSLISESGTCFAAFTPDLRIVRAIPPPPVRKRSLKPARSYPSHHRIFVPHQREADTAAGGARAIA